MTKKKPERLMFSMARLAALEADASGKRKRVWDIKVVSLCLHVTGRGAKAFYVTRWNDGRAEEIRIGGFPGLNVDQARKVAQQVVGSMALGESPAERRRTLRQEQTFGELFAWWLERARPHRSAGYLAEADRQFKKHLKDLAGRRAGHISRTDVRDLHAQLGAEHPYLANRVLSLVRAVYNKAIGHELIAGPNPAEKIEAFEEVSRERRLMPGESARFIEIVAGYPNVDARDFILMALFTGARRSNVLAMRWEQLDLAARTWRIGLTKNGLPQLIPLEDAEIEILTKRADKRQDGNPWVFPGRGATGHLVEPKKSWRRILELAGLATPKPKPKRRKKADADTAEATTTTAKTKPARSTSDLRLHDLRRTLGSFMADTGATSSVIGHALNHLSPAATAIYSRLSMNPVRKAKRAALAEMGANRGE